MIILEENFKWHLEAFASELFILSINIASDIENFKKVAKVSQNDHVPNIPIVLEVYDIQCNVLFNKNPDLSY